MKIEVRLSKEETEIVMKWYEINVKNGSPEIETEKDITLYNELHDFLNE